LLAGCYIASSSSSSCQQQSSQRDIDREIRELDRQEKQVVLDLKQRAKKVNSSNDKALQTLAKQLVQIRTQKTTMLSAKAQLGAMGMHATVTASQIAATAAIGKVTETMKMANGIMDPKATAKMMAEFQRENAKTEMMGEMMDDMLASAFDDDEIADEADQVTNQVLAELGVELDSQFASVPSNKIHGNSQTDQLSAQEQAAMDDLLPDLKARLDAL
jgi:charged multivesicular body protein 2B